MVNYPWYPGYRVNTSQQISNQTAGTYLNWEKTKEFEDVGYFLESYVVSGGFVTKNITHNNRIDISDTVVSLSNDIMHRDPADGIKLDYASSTYYVDFYKGDYWVYTAHPDGTAGVDYLTIARVTTDQYGNVSTIVDTVVNRGGFRLKPEISMPGYMNFKGTDEQTGITNLNDTNIDTGFYRLQSGYTQANPDIINNLPPGEDSGVLIVYFTSMRVQHWQGNTGRFYMRTYASFWQDWVDYVTEEELLAKISDYVTEVEFDEYVAKTAMVKIGEINVTGSSVTEVSFTNLDVSLGESLVLIGQFNYPNSGAMDNGIMLTFNSSPDNTYFRRQTSVFSATANYEQVQNRTIFVQPSANPAVLIADIGFATNGTSSFDGSNTIVTNYRVSSADSAKNATNIVGTLLFSRDGFSDSIDNINIRGIQTNSIRTGSRFSLYKRE